MAYRKLTPKKKNEFLDVLSRSCNVSKAANAIDISRTVLYEEREKDPVFAVDWGRAKEIAVEALEDEVHRRAFDGVPRTNKHGEYRQYSDTLAIFLLKAHKPERYSERIRNEISGLQGDPLDLNDTKVMAKLDAILGAAMQRRAAAEADYSDLA